MPAERRRIRLFISYSRRDQDLRAELDKHLTPMKRRELIDVWHDRQIDPGQEWDREIKRNLEDADIILLLVSADFMSSDYAWSQEMERALARHEAGEARVIPVILEPCEWELAPFAKIQALPRDARAVSTWANRAEALADVARGVRIVAEDIAKNPLERPVAPTPEEPEVAPRVLERQQAKASTTTEPSPEQGPRTGEVRTNPDDGEPCVWVPPGTFQMGCSPGDKECEEDEKPRHRVTISKGFWMGQTPVTVAAYRKFALTTKRSKPPAPDFSQEDDHPVVNVSWDDAQDYCQWAGGRLPTEAEWEYAARAGSEQARYGPLDEIAWYADNSGRERLDSTALWKADSDWTKYYEKLRKNGNQTHAVMTRKPNVFGLYDMLGNVWEWCADWYDKDYYVRSPARDPKSPEKGEMRLVRGGSWGVRPRGVRVSSRYGVRPECRGGLIGFRCVREVIP